ncbi:MAG: NAD(P)-dependent alcohol dehydrogenase [Pedobacter sp.]|nr:MAG: NAD(P)-dependent alcohol dehydrogenase [Pedobacter sp.]
MIAAVIENYGNPSVFKMKDIPVPELKEGEILVRNHASSVNPIDTLVRQGKTRIVTGLFGDKVIGADLSGRVSSSRNAAFKPGDEVFGFLNAANGGSYAEYVVVKGSNITLKPNNLDFTEAASLPLVAATAWQGMVILGKLKNNHKVLITGCTGGVGTAAVQIARSFQAHVTGTCSAKNADFAKQLGCDQVVIYDQEKIAVHESFDLIFDASGKFTFSDFKEQLNNGAMFVSTRGKMDGFRGTLLTIKDLLFSSQMKIVVVKPNQEVLQKIKSLACQ